MLAFTKESKVVNAILEHLGLPKTGPPAAPARIASAHEDAPWQDDVPELQLATTACNSTGFDPFTIHVYSLPGGPP